MEENKIKSSIVGDKSNLHKIKRVQKTENTSPAGELHLFRESYQAEEQIIQSKTGGEAAMTKPTPRLSHPVVTLQGDWESQQFPWGAI